MLATAIKDKPNRIKIVSKNTKAHSNTKQLKLKDVNKTTVPAVKRNKGTFDVVYGPANNIFEAVTLGEGSKRNIHH